MCVCGGGGGGYGRHTPIFLDEEASMHLLYESDEISLSMLYTL